LLRLCSAAIIGALFSFPTNAIGASGQLLYKHETPIADAWLVATRRGCLNFSLHCGGPDCLEVKVTKTDARGKYSFFSWFGSTDDYELFAYKNGYFSQRVLFHQPYITREPLDSQFFRMNKVSGRIAYLAELSGRMSCSSASLEQRSALMPVYKEMFSEAVAIARFPEELKVARKICHAMYLTQLSPRPSTYTSDFEVSLSDTERRQETLFLQGVEPRCNTPIDDSNDLNVLSAINNGDREFVHSAALKGFDFNRLLDGHNLPIVNATNKGDVEMVAELATDGAKANEVGEDGRTALEYVLTDWSRGHETPNRLSVIKALLHAGADPNRTDSGGYPPLIRVSFTFPSDVEMFELFLKHGSRVDQTVSCQDCNERGKSVMHFISDPTIARIAFQHGANVNAKTEMVVPPLMSAQTPEMVKILLELGADPNVTYNGLTPLMVAIRNYESFRGMQHEKQRRKMAEMLVEAGARLNDLNQQGVGCILLHQG